jgi:hypothetical protein
MNTIYLFKEMAIDFQVVAIIFRNMDLINNLIDIIINNYSNKYNHLKNKNIILMKTNRNSKVYLKWSQWNCEDFLVELEKK